MVRSIEQLVAEQVAKWTAARSGPKVERKETWPTITVSREFGSRGAAIGEAVAEALGFTYWDQELVHAVAEETGVKEQLLESLDEHAWGTIDEIISTFLLHTGGVKDYVRELAEVIHTIDNHGEAVVLGRGGQFLIDSGRALRVRIVSPFEKRVEDYAESKELSQKEAEKQVKEKEEDRQQFYNKYFKEDVSESSHYDLVLNSGVFSLDQSRELISTAYKTKFGKLPHVSG